MYCVPVNERVNMEEGSPYEYIDAILIEEALCVRFSDEDGDVDSRTIWFSMLVIY